MKTCEKMFVANKKTTNKRWCYKTKTVNKNCPPCPFRADLDRLNGQIKQPKIHWHPELLCPECDYTQDKFPIEIIKRFMEELK